MKTKEEIISRIVKLEHEIINKILTDKDFKANMDDEFKGHREELRRLRKLIIETPEEKEPKIKKEIKNKNEPKNKTKSE